MRGLLKLIGKILFVTVILASIITLSLCLGSSKKYIGTSFKNEKVLPSCYFKPIVGFVSSMDRYLKREETAVQNNTDNKINLSEKKLFNTFVYEFLSIVGIIISTIIAGVAITVTLSLTVWQSLSDAVFGTHCNIVSFLNEHSKHILPKHKKTLEFDLDRLEWSLRRMKVLINYGRKIFLSIIVISVIALILLYYLFLFPQINQEQYQYAGAYILGLIAVILVALTLLVIMPVTFAEPNPIKIKAQYDLATISRSLNIKSEPVKKRTLLQSLLDRIW